MIEVKLYLYDAQEIALMSQFEAILQQKRSQMLETTPTPLTPQPAQTSTPSGVNIPAAPTASTLTSAHVEAPAGGTVMMNDTEEPAVIGAGGGLPPVPVEVDDVTIQRTITAYGQKHGVPATVAKMQELFGVSQASKVPAERRAEFVEAFAV